MFAEKGYGAQIENFIRDLKNGKAPAVTVRDGARSTIGCLRMLESAKDLSANGAAVLGQFVPD